MGSNIPTYIDRSLTDVIIVDIDEKSLSKFGL